MKHLLFACLLLFIAGCGSERKFPEVKKLSEYKQTSFIVTPQGKLPQNKNTVYCTTLLLAWQEVKNAAGVPLRVDAAYPELVLLNDSRSHENTLGESEYKTMVDLDREEGKITVRAEFSKSLPFGSKFKNFDNELKFKNEGIAAFGMKADNSYDFYEQVKVLYYKNDNEFVIKLLPADKEHEIILYMTEGKPETFEDLIKIVAEKTNTGREEIKIKANVWKFVLGNDGDELLIPKINFNIEADYKNLESNSFNAGQEAFMIEKAWQRTAFMLDEAGAEIESEAEMTSTTEAPTGPVEKPHPKKLHFNKPFLVMLKRVDSPNPYFAMWVENTELFLKN